jgi:hypothetical protein
MQAGPRTVDLVGRTLMGKLRVDRVLGTSAR